MDWSANVLSYLASVTARSLVLFAVAARRDARLPREVRGGGSCRVDGRRRRHAAAGRPVAGAAAAVRCTS